MNEELQALLKRWGEQTIAKMIAVLTSEDKVATKTLVNSLQIKFGKDFIQFLVADYGQWVESGSKAHWIPVSKYPGVATGFKKWAQAKGISKMITRYAALEKSNKGYIHVNKQQPVKFFQTVIENELDNLLPEIKDHIVQYIENKVQLIAKS